MLKNRKLILLTILTGIVWAMIGYRIYDYLTSVSQVTQIQRHSVLVEAQNIKYSLALNYNDPFLVGGSKSLVTNELRKKGYTNQIKLAKENVQLIDWSIISYLGQVKNNSRDNTTAIVRINGVDFFVKESEAINEFKILTIFSDSIKVVNTDQIRYVKRQKI